MSKGKLKQKKRKQGQADRWSKRPIPERRELPDETPLVTALVASALVSKLQSKLS